MDVSQCQLQGRPVRTSNPFGPPAAPACGKGPRKPDQGRGVLDSCRHSVLSTYEGRQPGKLHLWTIKVSTAEPSGTSDSHTETRNASLKEEALPEIRSVSFKFASLGSNSSFQGR